MRLVALLAALAASPAMAQQGCIGTADAYASLTTNYGEEVASRMVLSDGRMLELWVNHETKTWSLFVTHPQGMSCPVGSGIGFETYPAKPNL